MSIFTRAQRLSPGWLLLPLRLFLGVTFTFAGAQKLANPAFFRASNPGSIQAQLNAFALRSPLHVVLGLAAHVPVLTGLMIALGELAVGLGTLLGIYSKVAALGGAAISLLLFLSVSFHTNPYYTGSDIVFIFAWIPFLIVGAGGVLSVQNFIARRRGGAIQPTIAGVEFSTIQNGCGNFEDGSCRAMHLDPCSMVRCPVINIQNIPDASQSDQIATNAGYYDPQRRSFLVRAGSLGIAGGAVVAVGGSSAVLGRIIGAKDVASLPTGALANSTATSSTPTTSVVPATTSSQATVSSPQPTPSSTSSTVVAGVQNPKGSEVGPASAVPVGKIASFVDPKSGQPAYVLHPKAADFLAFSAVCPHAGCTVQYSVGNVFICPCHGSQFNADTGEVIQGPAITGLSSIAIVEGSNGQLYVDG